MAFHPQVVVQGNRVHRICPVCELDYMVRGEDGVWQCQNENCGHREEA